MQSATQTIRASVSKRALWTGRLFSGFAVLFLLFDSTMKLMKTAPVLETMPNLGWPATLAAPLGAILLVCLIVYVIPKTSVLGAILLTGYLGGAVATHVRIGNPLFSHILFPTYLGLFLWAGLYFREPRLRELIPLRGERT